MLLGSFSFVGIGMIAAILPLLYVERGAQMTFVLQSCLLLVSGVYYSVDDPARLDAGAVAPVAGDVRPRRRAGRARQGHARVGADARRVAAASWLGIVLIPFGLWAFGRAERYAKRTGKLKRVG